MDVWGGCNPPTVRASPRRVSPALRCGQHFVYGCVGRVQPAGGPSGQPQVVVPQARRQRQVVGEDLLPPAIEVSAAAHPGADTSIAGRSEEHTSELQSRENIVCRLLLE